MICLGASVKQKAGVGKITERTEQSNTVHTPILGLLLEIFLAEKEFRILSRVKSWNRMREISSDQFLRLVPSHDSSRTESYANIAYVGKC